MHCPSSVLFFGFRATEAWRSEFWPPLVADGVLALVTSLSRKCAWFADATARRQFAIAVPQVRTCLSYIQQGFCFDLESSTSDAPIVMELPSHSSSIFPLLEGCTVIMVSAT